MSNQKEYILLSDRSALKELSEKDRTLIKEHVTETISIDNDYKEKLGKDTVVLLFLSDENVKKVLPSLKEKGCIVGFLPHPKSHALNSGFSLNKSFNKAFHEVLDAKAEIISDLLYCNDEPVLNYVTSGDIMTFLTKRNKFGIMKGLKNLFRFLKHLPTVKAKLVSIKADEKEEFETAVTDLLIVQHGKNAMVSRILLEKSFVNDNMFHAFIFSPRSIMQLVNAYFLKLFLGKTQKNTAFEFLGQIKTNAITITFSEKTKYSIDDTTKSAESINLSIKSGLRIIPSNDLIFTSQEEKSKKVYLIDKLPRGETKKDMVAKSLPWLKHASTEEYKELFTQLRENAKPRQTYVVLMILSTLLATFGLFSNSSPVIIGAMILAPLMSPIISLSMGVLRQDRSLIKSSTVTILVGLGVGYLFAIILTLITPLSDLNTEISARTNPNIIDLGIAVVSGVAGAYAHSKEQIAKTLAGVAIAVALVPPLAVSGIGIGWGNWSVFFGSFLLLLTNLTGMVLAGSLTFLLTGYSPFRLARKGLLISGFIVLALSIPLGYGFVKIVQENQIIQSVNHYTVDGIEIKDVAVVKYNPLTLSIKVVSNNQLTEEEMDKIKTEIEAILDREVSLEINVNIKK